MTKRTSRIRRNIQQSVTELHETKGSMAGLCAISFHEISGIQCRFGNKPEQALF
jgi:hypothetical protein